MKYLLALLICTILPVEANDRINIEIPYASSSFTAIKLAVIRKTVSLPFLYLTCIYFRGYFECNPYEKDYRIISSVVLAPIIEEFLMRGYILSLLDKFENQFLSDNLKNKFAITFSSLVFGIAHLLNPKPSYIQVINATIGGFLYAYVYHTYGIHASIICHMSSNSISLLESYFLGLW